MNANILSILVLAIVAGLLVLFLRQYKPEYALLVATVAAAFVVFLLLEDLIFVIDEIRNIFAQVELPTEYLAVVFKTLGICYLTQFAADICRDFGQTSLSSKVELAGKIMIVILSIPIVKEVIGISVGLIQT